MKKFLLIILVIFSFGVKAQKISFTQKAPGAVELGESFNVVYQINRNGNSFKGPTFKDFDYQGGPYTSSSQSYQMINGSTTQSVSLSYTYQLRASKVGKFTLPAATIKVNGKTYKSNSRVIEVVKGNNPAPPSSSSNSNPSTKGANSDKAIPEGIIFGRTLVNKKNVYVGEPILVTQKIYSKKQIANVTDFKEPSYDGFWKEDIDIGQLKLTKENYGGQVYFTVTLQKMILFPQKVGKLDLGSFDLNAVISIRKTRKARNQWEYWQYGDKVVTAENTNVSINSPKVNINVKSIPEAGRPKDYTGVVGNFTFSAKLDKSKVEANDAINLKLVVKGNGNIDLLDIPKPAFPSDFEIYDPKIKTKSDNSVAGVNGSKSYEYLIIPRNEGLYEIPPISFSYFDVSKGKFITLKSDTFRIKVGKGKASTVLRTSDDINRTDVKYLDQDIRFIKTNSNHWQPIGFHYFNSLLHISLLILFPILLILAIIIFNRNRKQKADVVSMKNKRATKVARKRLKNADKLLKANKQKEFFIEISLVLWGYLSDKFSIPVSELSMDNIREKLRSKMDEETIEEVIKVVDKCEYARFAPSGSTSISQEIYDESMDIISKIEKLLR